MFRGNRRSLPWTVILPLGIAIALSVAAPPALGQDAAPPSLEAFFAALPSALVEGDRAARAELFAQSDIRLHLMALDGRRELGDPGAFYSAEQVLFLLDEYFDGVELRSSDLRCECDPSTARRGRASGVLEIRPDGERGAPMDRLYFRLRRGDAGWRIVELRRVP